MPESRAPLPAQVCVFVRDWLSSNNILLKSRDGHVLVDSGYVRHAPLTLALLDRRRLSLRDLPEYMERVAIYRQFNALFFRLPAAQLAALLIGELERAGAVRRDQGWLLPA